MKRERARVKRNVRRAMRELPPDAQRLVEIELAWEMHRGRQVGGLPLDSWGRRRLMQRLAGAQNWRCCHCGVRTNEATRPEDQPTIEHVIPRALGGTNDEANLAMACADCNNKRGHDLAWSPKGKT